MAIDLERYEKGQVYLLKDGTFAYVADVDPMTKLNKDDKSRRVSCKVGHFYKKGDTFKGQYIAAIEDESYGIRLTIDVSKMKYFTISELKNKEARYLGRLNNDKQKLIDKLTGEYIDSQGW